MSNLNQLSRFVVGLGLAPIAGVMLSLPVLAQSYSNPNADAGEVLDSSDTSNDPFSSNAGFGSFFDLIHRAQQSGSQTYGEFREEQGQNIRTEADAFRQRQLELLRQRQQTTQPMGETAPGN